MGIALLSGYAQPKTVFVVVNTHKRMCFNIMLNKSLYKPSAVGFLSSAKIECPEWSCGGMKSPAWR